MIRLLQNHLILSKPASSANVEEALLVYGISRKKTQSLLQKGQLSEEKDTITIQLPLETVDYAPAKDACPILYEDETLLVVHKERGLIIHEDDKTKLGTLANQVARYYLDQGIEAPVRFIHRLDKDTEGLVLFVKIPLLQPYFDDQLAQHKIHRSYLAIVEGVIPEGSSQLVEEPIGKDRHRNNVYRVSPTGKLAKTSITSLETNGSVTLVRCVLYTGRTHQIRVHTAYLGHPVVNDPIYGTKKNAQYEGLQLYGDLLELTKPNEKESLTIVDSFCHPVLVKSVESVPKLK